MNLFTLVIPGRPVAKARPRFFRREKFVGTYNCQETEEGRFLWECKAQLMKIGWITPIEQGIPVELVCRFYFPIPKAEKKIFQRALEGPVFHTKNTGDLSNCIKFIEDCFNDFIWHDDCQIVRISALKFYGVSPRTEISVGTME